MGGKDYASAMFIRQALAEGKRPLWACATERQAVSLRANYPDLAPYIKTTESAPTGDRATFMVYDEAKNIKGVKK